MGGRTQGGHAHNRMSGPPDIAEKSMSGLCPAPLSNPSCGAKNRADTWDLSMSGHVRPPRTFPIGLTEGSPMGCRGGIQTSPIPAANRFYTLATGRRVEDDG